MDWITEHAIQTSYFQWVNFVLPEDVALQIYASANGGKRNIGTASKLQQSGVRPGVLDVAIDIPISCISGRSCPGARIEFKNGRNKPSEHQLKTITRLKKLGYCIGVFWTWYHARDWTVEYLTGKLEPGDCRGWPR